MTHDFWEHLIDSKLCGGYLLRRLIGSTETGAVYFTSYGEEPAALKLTTHTEEPPVKEHPNIIRLLAQGTCEVEGTKLRYLVTEYAEENLGAVIASRPLTPEEARELAGPVVEALAFLHKRLLVHGRIQPSNILAKGDTIKLSMDSIGPIRAGATPEDDMHALGLTLVEVLTQRREAAAIPPLEQPFRDIVEHTLHPDAAVRWTASQVAMRLTGKVPPAPRPASPAEALAATTAPAEPVAATRSEPQPVPRALSSNKRVPIWALPAAGIAMLLGVVFVLAHGPTTDAPARNPQPLPPPRTEAPRAQAVVPPKPAPFDIPKKPVPQPLPPPKMAPKPAARPDAHGWFVVVASYAREADAVQRAQSLGRRYAQFKLSVFPPSAIDTHYLVILGSGLTAEAADSLRARAIASGLPPDTYIKKYPARP